MGKKPKPISSKLLLVLTGTLLWWAAAAKVRHFKWAVEYMVWAPDCEEAVVMGINGQYPGPTIRARVGDIVHVELTNRLSTEGLVIHWHGIRQLGTPWADGTASISQCPIRPGESFTYRFRLDKAGTYFYHGHYGMQRSAGLYGSLIVEGDAEPFRYDGEFNLLLSDWWHRSSLDLEVDLSSKPFRWVGETQSLLINGRGQYNCSLAPGFGNSSTTQCELRGTEQCAPQILRVLPNKVYRIRLASVTSLASLNLAIQGHKMVVVEADGNYIQPFNVEDLDIYSGESYSVLVTTNQPFSNYWISVGVRGRQPHTPPALTILNYHPTSTAKLPIGPPPTTPLWNNFTHSKAFTSSILSLPDSLTPPQTPHRRLHLLNTQNKVDGYIKWALNNVSLVLPPTPYLGSIKYNLTKAYTATAPPDSFSSSYDIMQPPTNPNATFGNGVYTLELNSTVDVVLQNANALGPNASEVHPWHLHGHDFWVLGYGEGRFQEEDVNGFNLENPPLRNTAVVFPYGWTALRFVADNPGVWAFHCHIEPHLHMGMGVVFAEGVEHVKGIPASAVACGLVVEKMFMKNMYVP